MRALGVDPGARRVGLALSDEDRILASPHSTLEVGGLEDAVQRVVAAAAELEAGTLVVGLPLRLDGSEGQSAFRVRRFAAAVAERSGLEVVLWDERLSSAAAERALREGGVSGRRRRGLTDRVAAALLLQSYLDAQRDARER
ncbi:MAG: Holliday junction resolvase RuvX [Myxococcales bacterium]|nr:Holliday junction resolvase RuvX [Myxococcales bacterium]